MKNFLRIMQGVNVMPALLAVNLKPELWDENTLRTMHPNSAHSACSDIWVMFNDLKPSEEDAVINDRDVIPYRAWQELPEVRDLVLGLMAAVKGVRLGRVIITKLPPGQSITPHVDGGAPAEYFTRFQIVLQSLPGCIFKIGSEQVQFAGGEVWRINNREEHGVQNNSADDRIVIIVDIRTE